MWIYMKTEKNLYSVGFYKPNGEFYTVRDFGLQGDAARYTHYLNGGDKFGFE